uniref:Uncharacterized protein n=1 Tax=Peronospora matthiolae TaxID=2874970 RepID=A0AAV1TKD6_9STRA
MGDARAAGCKKSTVHYRFKMAQTISATQWETSANASAVSAAEHAGRRDVTAVRKRADLFETRVMTTYAEDGGVIV